MFIAVIVFEFIAFVGTPAAGNDGILSRRSKETAKSFFIKRLTLIFCPPPGQFETPFLMRAGADGVDVDLVHSHLLGHRLGEPYHGELRRAVGGITGDSALAGAGGNVDNLAAAAPVDHVSRHRP